MLLLFWKLPPVTGTDSGLGETQAVVVFAAGMGAHLAWSETGGAVVVSETGGVVVVAAEMGATVVWNETSAAVTFVELLGCVVVFVPALAGTPAFGRIGVLVEV